MRVFAGPNGSGKSTIINSVRNHRINNIPVDFGIYINADDIGARLRKGVFTFGTYKIKVEIDEFIFISSESGLINKNFTLLQFKNSFSLKDNKIRLESKENGDRLAQIIADLLRKKLLNERKKFSFDTVFSHPGKIEIMKDAVEAGYKVYFYFVATESPRINILRKECKSTKQWARCPGGEDHQPVLSFLGSNL